MKRHPWKTQKYIRFENALQANHDIPSLGVWLQGQIGGQLDGEQRSFKAVARTLDTLVGESVSHETVRTWFMDWLEHGNPVSAS